jgi:glycosyltransferase involved in cell wall biosynthesis
VIHVVFIIANNSSVPYFTWFARAASKQQEFKFSFVALHSERPKMLEEMPALGCDAYWIPFTPASRGKSMLKAIPSLYRLFKKIRPDIVHSHLFDDSVPSLIAARLAGIKTRVITKQDTTFHWFYAPKGVKYDRLNNRNATNLVAVSEECRNFIIEKEKADKRKIHLIHHGIPPELAAQSEETKKRLRDELDLHNKPIIGTVARLIEWKGYRHIIAAAEIVVKAYPEARFLFAGTGHQEKELKELAKEKGLEKNVLFLGWVDRKDIPSLYGIMDVYAHAATFEPFGFVLAEAMMNGTPVVSTRTGAALDAIEHGKNGYLVDYGNPSQLAEGIIHLLAHDNKAMGEKAREKAMSMYSFERMWSKHLDLYRQAYAKQKKTLTVA